MDTEAFGPMNFRTSYLRDFVVYIEVYPSTVI